MELACCLLLNRVLVIGSSWCPVARPRRSNSGFCYIQKLREIRIYVRTEGREGKCAQVQSQNLGPCNASHRDISWKLAISGWDWSAGTALICGAFAAERRMRTIHSIYAFSVSISSALSSAGSAARR